VLTADCIRDASPNLLRKYPLLRDRHPQKNGDGRIYAAELALGSVEGLSSHQLPLAKNKAMIRPSWLALAFAARV